MSDCIIDQEFELLGKLIEEIDIIAEENNISKNNIVSQAIKNYIYQKEKEKNEN